MSNRAPRASKFKITKDRCVNAHRYGATQPPRCGCKDCAAAWVNACLAKKVGAEGATVKELRGQLRRLERRAASLRTKEELIQAAVLDVLKGSAPTIEAPPRPKLGRRRAAKEEVAVLHLSDWQLGKVTKSYDTSVAEARAAETFEKVALITELRRSHADIRELRVYLGGDMVEGEDIFPHQAHEIDSPLYDQACVNGPRILARGLMTALETFDHVWVGSVDGNHGRNGSKHTRSSPKTNWDRVLSNTLRAVLLGTDELPRKELAGRLDFQIADDFYFIDRVLGWGNLVVHGHQIGGGFAGFPWYGVGKKAWGWADSIEEPWDNLFLGHFHTPVMQHLGNKRVFANGTLESDNNFAKEQLAACGVPAQRLCFMNRRIGVISDDVVELLPRRPRR